LEQNTKGIHILARKFVTTISQYQTQSVNLTPLVNQVGFEMMSQSTFSRQFDLDSGDQTKVALQSLYESQALLGTYGHVPWIYAIAKYCTGLLPSNDRFTKLADHMVAHRRNQEPESPDLFSFLFQTENNGKRGLPLSLGGENSDPSLEESESVLKTSTVRIHPTLSYLAAFTLPPIRRFSLRFTTRFPPSYLRVNLTCASHSRYWIQLYANQ
jgi:hypothetical protein